ncbi:hypothetical protein MHC_01885 [Mycoplasma haemocanis str. Illinois]|uniref:Uncharacterized protein n=1 Tax=Mycoplasma haemocanis (strain Illinois) TaxID=1111676 RepID=H6N6H1_MYCHN|nr:hypothetical protein [Mycoplasma haemocanis]AEW45243.1 hypothetical protein MHC_01885 [Mycoplasma haemocanis str. Illinois]
MALGVLAKGSIVLGGIGSSVGGYFLINNLTSRSEGNIRSTKSIRDKLVQEGYTLLNFENTTGNEWEKIKAEYKKENVDAKRFAGVNKDDDATVLAGIKNSCLQYLQEETENEDNYKLSRRWCVVPISVQNKLKGKTFLKTDAGDSNDNSDWDKLVTKHDSHSDKWISFETGKSTEEKRTKIKEQCAAQSKLETTNAGFEDALKNVDLWCTKESVPKE